MTQSLSPVTTPSLIYPSMGPSRRRRCKNCYSTNISPTRTRYFESYKSEEIVCKNCGWQGSYVEELPQVVALNETLVNQMLTLHQGTDSENIEFGALIVRKEDKLYLAYPQRGKAHEVTFKYPETLRKGEEVLGTFHVHPTLALPSHWDFGAFLVNKFEQMSVVAGPPRNLTLMLKTDSSFKVDDTKMEEWVNERRSFSIPELSKICNVALYEGSYNKLILKVGEADMREESLDNLLMGYKGTKKIK